MKIRDCMTRDVRTVAPDQSLRDAARIMAERDLGALPVGENDRLIGMITDRDIAVRAVAGGRGPDASVREAMTYDVKYCFDDEDVQHVARNMGEIQVRRLPVLDRQKRLVGIVALGDLATTDTNQRMLGDTLSGISREGGHHTQNPARSTDRH